MNGDVLDAGQPPEDINFLRACSDETENLTSSFIFFTSTIFY